ncbi:GNAT family N-acetyltransferase [Sphingomonas sabuli]|uniref:GNAT family N-acetyltransferase n=1 Tax=Sphingomonas sabuli TaxID=2764186 RepID=A0A7G9L579_9SPHN|nr:GNAT family protein [Sphingomonas sabuli]QNM83778.1 GNAT family N-acetyltransferase [Sphingomonas sabuli]
MVGDGCRAEPFQPERHEALKAACAEDREIWHIYSVNCGPEAFDETIVRLLARPDTVTFTLWQDDELVGMSSYLRIDPANRGLEIGFTYYRPHFRGTGINRRIKDMMIRRAIEAGFIRIEFRVDARNVRSQAAMARLGAVREGVRRADTITWTGHVRDTVLFSILKDEWPT